MFDVQLRLLGRDGGYSLTSIDRPELWGSEIGQDIFDKDREISVLTTLPRSLERSMSYYLFTLRQ